MLATGLRLGAVAIETAPANAGGVINAIELLLNGLEFSGRMLDVTSPGTSPINKYTVRHLSVSVKQPKFLNLSETALISTTVPADFQFFLEILTFRSLIFAKSVRVNSTFFH